MKGNVVGNTSGPIIQILYKDLYSLLFLPTFFDLRKTFNV